MELTEPLRRKLVQAMADAVIAHVDELSALDAAAGDGDHGHNMQRGFRAVLDRLDDIAARPLPQAAQELGKTLVMHVGGASGAIFGTAFIAAGKSLPEAPTRDDGLAALDAAIAAVRARGKVEPGQKTMLDVLVPVAAAWRDGAPDLAAAAEHAAEATASMPAVRGRASFLGERSLGHVDAGARSAALLIAALCRALEEHP
jgi:dihydroxyacetone kinase-like protein